MKSEWPEAEGRENAPHMKKQLLYGFEAMAEWGPSSHFPCGAGGDKEGPGGWVKANFQCYTSETCKNLKTLL